MLYFDDTATTRPSKDSLNTFIKVSAEYWGNPSSTNYDPGIEARRKLEEARATIADCIGAKPDQIFFTSGSTEGANWIVQRTPKTFMVFTTEMEHPAVYESARSSNKPLIYLKLDENGRVDLDDLQHMFGVMGPQLYGDDANILVAITDSNNETGVCQPTREIANICHQYGAKVRLFADMTQSFAHSDVYKVDDLGYDFAIASAQKFRAPRGVGFVYARHPDDLEPLLYGGHQEGGKRAGTEPVALICAMAGQFKRECENRAKNNVAIQRTKDYLLGKLYARIGDFKINGGEKNVLPSVLSICLNNCDANRLLSYLAMDGIYLSAGSACSTGENKPSRILKAMGMSDRDAQSTIRISLNESISHRDIDELVEAIAAKLSLCRWDIQ